MQRNIDELGRITIPANMRKQLEINVGNPVNIECTGNKVIITKPDTVDYKAIVEETIRYINSRCLEKNGYVGYGDDLSPIDLIEILTEQKIDE